ncbi:MAG: hypothetical protein RIR70_712, partial [Pseudomonadota bacterium]
MSSAIGSIDHAGWRGLSITGTIHQSGRGCLQLARFRDIDEIGFEFAPGLD